MCLNKNVTQKTQHAASTQEDLVIRDWLTVSDRTTGSYNFKITDLTEVTSPSSNEDLMVWLATQLLDAHTNIEHLKRKYHDKPQNVLKDYVSTYVFPPARNTLEENGRRGDWGEVISDLVLRDIRNLTTSLIKLRYKLNRRKVTFGIDVFGIESDNAEVIAVYICEVKTRITYDKEVGRKAVESLRIHDTNAIVDISEFMAEIHFNAGDMDMADRYDAIAYRAATPTEPAIPIKQEIFLLCEKNLWKEEILQKLQSMDEPPTDFTVNVVLVQNLDEIYRNSVVLTPQVAKELIYDS